MHRRLARSGIAASLFSAVFLLAACGGGGSGSTTPPADNPPTDNPPTDPPPPVTYPAVGALDGSADEQVFVPGQVLTYTVTMKLEDRQYLEAHGVGEEWMSATVVVTGDGATTDLGEVGFRHKGGYGTLDMCWGPVDPAVSDGDPNTETHEEMLSRQRLDESFCRKISYKFKFNKKRPFHGLKKLNLHSGSRDPTMLHDMMAYSLFYDFGVDAPRTSPAKLYINGDYMGLFIAVEDVDDAYAAAHYPAAAGGNLYKEVWPDPEKLDAWAHNPYTFADLAAEHQDEGDDPSDFVALTEALRAGVLAGSVAPLAAQVSTDELLRYIAVDRAIKNWDGITAMYTGQYPDPAVAKTFRWPHNYYWYHATGTDGRFHLVPWDMDNTFQANDPYTDPKHSWEGPDTIPNWNVKPRDCHTPLAVWNSTSWVMPPGCDPFLNLLASTQWTRFRELGNELLAGPLRTSALQQKARAWASLIEPLVREDPVIDYATWKAEKDLLINDILVRMPGEFSALLEQGYVVER